MFQNPHIVPNSVGANATIRIGRADGIATGTWWEVATRTDGKFHICKEAISTTGIIINQSGYVGIGLDPSYPVHVVDGSSNASLDPSYPLHVMDGSSNATAFS